MEHPNVASSENIGNIFNVFKTSDSGSQLPVKKRKSGTPLSSIGSTPSVLPPKPAPITLPAPTGYSQKDIPEVSLRFTTLGIHPLFEKKIWRQICTTTNSAKIYDLDMSTVDSYKGNGFLNIPGYVEQVLPHPTQSNLVISSSDFEDGFVLDDDHSDTIKYWLIRCKSTGVYLRLNNC